MPPRATAGHLALAAALAAPAPPIPPRPPHLPYEVVDGLAIRAGDIVLGTAEEAASRSASARPLAPSPRALALPQHGAALWPEGVVPYVIDPALPAGAARTIEAAIAEWNNQTVISLVPRSAESDYVRFIPSERCASHVGRQGGEQLVWAGRGPECGVRQLHGAIHEIGHVVGLDHEHQRSDRDDYGTVSHGDLDPRWREWYTPWRSAEGPYDFRSAMHYWMAVKSVPPGIEIAPGGLSAGDIDGVARLYGRPPRATTIATNPPGLTVLVDGIAHTAPARFEWDPGTPHRVAIPAEPQGSAGSRYLFARWNDDAAGRIRTVTAGEDGTWIEANFIVQHLLASSVEPIQAGAVETSLPDGWHTRGARIVASARAARPEMAFWRWNRWAPHGFSANPAEILVSAGPVNLVAYFTATPLFRIASNAPSFVLELDERWHMAPTAIAPRPDGRAARVRIAETQPAPGSTPGTRYRFQSWSDSSEAASREIALPPAGGELRAIFSTEHSLRPAAHPVGGGRVFVTPPSDDGYYAEGTAVTASPAPNAGWEFARWVGVDTDPFSVTMDRPRTAEAWFSRTSQLQPGAVENVALPSDGPGFRFAAPDSASEIVLKFRTPNAAPRMEMQVRSFSSPLEPGLHGWERLHTHSSWRDRLRPADFVAKPADGQLELAIGYETDPPLDPEALYFVVLVSDSTPVAGTLSLEVTSSGPRPPRARAWPRAFTFVSDAGSDPHSQVFELRNEGGTAMQFEASSEASWLAADPAQGSIAPGASAELAVRVAGQVPADTHAATLDLSLGGPYGPLPELSLPVTFVAVPQPAAAAAQ